MDDRSFSKETRQASGPLKGDRALAKRYRLQVELQRLSRHGKTVYASIPAPVRKASKHSIFYCSRATAVATLLVLLAIGGLYARLLTGPISLSFLAPKVESRLNAQIKGASFRIGDAILRLSQNWGLEFRLANVSVFDENNQEIAKAPLAAIDLNERSLLTFSPQASQIELIGPKVLIFSLPGKGLALTASPDASASAASAWTTTEMTLDVPSVSKPLQEPVEIAGVRGMARQALNTEPSAARFNPAPFLSQLFAAVGEPGVATVLQRVGMKDATVYFASDKGVSTWKVADLHANLEDGDGASRTVSGEVTLENGDDAWRASFSATNDARKKIYAVTASIRDIVPRTVWRTIATLEPLKLADMPVSGQARFNVSHDGHLLGAEAEIELGKGRLLANDKRPVEIDGGLIKASYDRAADAIRIEPIELRWGDARLKIAGSISHNLDAATQRSLWTANLDGKGTVLSAPQFAVKPFAVDSFKIAGTYNETEDNLVLNDFHLQAGAARIAFSGQASALGSDGPVVVNGAISAMPIPVMKAAWPAFSFVRTREWVGLNVPSGHIASGGMALNLSAADVAELWRGGDMPDDALSLELKISGAQLYHIKGLPPILTTDSVVHMNAKRLVYDIPEARIDVPSGRSISFSEGQLLVEDYRPEFPDADVHFKAAGEVTGVLELLDQPPLNYVKAVGFKPSFVNGQAQCAFEIKFPTVPDLQFKQVSVTGKTKVSDLKSNALPGGFTLNGGALNFDIAETMIAAAGEIRVNGVPVSLAWQRFFDAPADKQPTLRLAAILNEKGREELGINVNHIVKGDLPVALAIAMQRDGPQKLFMEANLTNADLFLAAIGWRKPPGQKASLNFDLSQRQDGSLLLDNFALTGDQINVRGHLLLNEKRRLAGFSFPEFSPNAATKLALSGDLTAQNILKIQAKGESYDGRGFFRSMLNAGKIAENEPPPLKDEPGLDINAEIETVTGFYDTSVKSVIVDAKRRGGKLTFLEIAGRLNGEAPVAVHVEQRGRDARTLFSDATDAGSAFRLVGLYPAMKGGAMNLRINLDGAGGADKTGVLDVRRFVVVGDEVLGKIVTQAEKEGARRKSDVRPANQRMNSGEPLQFDRMVIPFSVGNNQLHLHEAAINGPVMGATLRGRIDFTRETINLSGTYVPLYGFNSVLGNVPLFGDLLKGRDNEGVFGITFAVQGRTSNPDVVVNPVSVFAPGFLRQIFEFEQAPAQQIPQRPTAQSGGNG